MPYYFVAKTPNGRFAGQYAVEGFPGLVKSGRIRAGDFTTVAAGTYHRCREAQFG